MVEQDKDLEQRLRDLQAHVDRVQQAQREVENAISEQDHQMRRVSDRLERGEGTAALEGECDRLRESQAVNRREHEDHGRQLEQLRAEREELERRLQELKANAATGGDNRSA
jgi:chromosome segregation ATPase